ncbi:MAG: carboxypeptidase-like regulatory domain-containing protein [Bacteroidales bacterium]|nr:carboxypeptidase-like regulatory domain-containing protein [Bacteroidales bacterium]
MKRILILAFVLSTTCISFCNNKENTAKVTANNFNVEGNISDIISGEELTGVMVKVDNQVVYTDFNGSFKLSNLNAGKHTIEVSCISYKPVKKIVNLDDKSVSNLKIQMKNF